LKTPLAYTQSLFTRLNIRYLNTTSNEIDLDSPELFDDLEFGNLIRAEASFGMSEVQPALDRLARGSDPPKVLEVGCGTGWLVSKFAEENPKLQFYGLEPIGKGFDSFLSAFEKILGNSRTVQTFRTVIEEFDSSQRFDLIYSINVFEHLDDWQEGIRICVEHLKPGGKLLILCPNYDIPYESHFSIPIVFNKETTRRVFKRKIDQYHAKIGKTGTWDSLNFIKASEVAAYASGRNYHYEFDRSVFSRMLRRLANDQKFSERHGALSSLGRIALKCGAEKVSEKLPYTFQPYMKATISIS